MKTFVGIVVVLFSGFARAEDWSKVYQQNKSSIPLIMNSGGVCGGSLIAPDLVLTAFHCITPSRPTYLSWNENIETFEEVSLVEFDRNNDIAFLKIKPQTQKTPMKIIADPNQVQVGEPIATIGHPLTPGKGEANKRSNFNTNDSYLISSGIVSGKLKDSIITDASLTPGNSGGPILNLKGEVVGVVSKKRIDSGVGNIGYATSSHAITELVAYHKKNGDKKITARDAGLDFRGGLGFQFMQVPKEYSGGDQSFADESYWLKQAYLKLGFSIWDRLLLDYNLPISIDMRMSRFSVGYKFQIETSEVSPMYLSPFLTSNSAKFRVRDGITQDVNFRTAGLAIGGNGMTLRFEKSLGDFPVYLLTLETGTL